MIHIYQTFDTNTHYSEIIRKFGLLETHHDSCSIVFPSNRWKSDFLDILAKNKESNTIILNDFFSYNSFLLTLFQKAQLFHDHLSLKKPLTDNLKVKLFEALIDEHAENLSFFTNSLDKKAKKHFIKRLDQSIISLKIQGYSPKSFQNKIENDEDLQNAKVSDLSLFFTKVMEQIYSKFYDDLSIQYDLVKHLNEEIIQAFNSNSKQIAFVGFDSFNPLFLTVLEKLNILNLEIHIFLPGKLNDTVLTHTNNHFKRFKNQQDLIFHEEKKLQDRTQAQFYFENFQDFNDELEAIIQKIIHLNVQNHVDLKDITLTISNVDSLQNQIRSKFDEYAVPINMSASLALRENQAIIHFMVLLNLIQNNFKFTDLLKFVDFAPDFEKFPKNTFYSLCNQNKCYQGYKQLEAMLENHSNLKRYFDKLAYTQKLDIHKKIQVSNLDTIIKELLSHLNYEEKILKLSESDIHIAQSYSRAIYSLYEIHDNLLSSFLSLNRYDLSLSEYFTFLIEEINDASYQIPEKKDFGVNILPFIEARSSQMDYLFVASLKQSEFPRLKVKHTFFNENEESKFELEDDQDSIYEDLYLFDCLKKKKSKETYFSSHTKDTENDSVSFVISDYEQRFESWAITDYKYKNNNALNYDKPFLNTSDIDKEIGKRELQKIFSASRLQMYQDCSYKYFIHYVNGIRKNVEKEIDLENLDLGNIVHKVLHDFHLQLFQNEKQTIDQKAILKNALKNQMNLIKDKDNKVYEDLLIDLIAINSEPGLFDDYLEFIESNDYKHFVPTYFEWSFGQDEVQSSDHMIKNDFSFESDKGPIKFKGTIDRIDIDENNKKYLLIDYKFKNKKVASERNDMHKDMYLQIPLYLIILDKIFNKEYQLEDAMLIHLRSGPEMDDIMALFNRKLIPYQDLLERYQKIVNELINELYESKFLLNPNPKKKEICKYCDYSNVCRIKEKTF